ncbi:hypothetical protein PGT21_018532 [Puccinia graminis f. sp. tritici]|uniref:Uncharacterized protein n=1 Tax=Puccinia graminis f. sp. tritici TaxID=56615 RepID=A0A5B0PRC5_PUCGR|nr:hypothetical protein PGT21_018532 [Puccinia graminis f. sp. tritici]
MLGFQAVTLRKKCFEELLVDAWLQLNLQMSMFPQAHGIVGIPADKDDCGTLKSNSAQSLAIWVEKHLQIRVSSLHAKKERGALDITRTGKKYANTNDQLTKLDELVVLETWTVIRSELLPFVSGRRSQELPDQYICTTQFVSLVEAPHAEFGYSESS